MRARRMRPPCARKGHRHLGRLTLGIFFLGAWLLGEAAAPAPAVAQKGPLREFLPELFGRGLPTCENLKATTCSLIHFVLTPTAELQRLNDSIAPQLVLPPSASPSSGFIFDMELGIPRRVREPLGPIIGEKALSLGQGRVNVGLTYSYLHYTRFRGQNLSDLQLTIPHEVVGPPFQGQNDTVALHLDLQIVRHVLTLSASAGVTDDLDLRFSIPYIFTSLRADAVATLTSPGGVHFFIGGGNQFAVSKRQSARGFGDLRLLGKYIVLRDLDWIGNLGMTGELKLPTGRAGDFNGTDTTQVTGTLVASRDFDWLGPHLNIGMTYDSHHKHALRTLAGFDARLIRGLTLASEVVWRFRTHGGSGSHIVDFVPGLRWNPYRDLVVTASAQLPLNKNVGLRTDVTPSLTVEYTF